MSEPTGGNPSVQLMLKHKRIAFPALAEPQAIGDGKPAYGLRMPIRPDDADVARIDEAMRQVAKAKWKDAGESLLQMLIEEKKVCFEKREYRSKSTGKVFGGFEGTYSLGGRSEKTKPNCFDEYGKQLTSAAEIESKLYSGCYAHVKVEIWAQDNTYGKRINCSVLGVMFAEDGESFGGGSQPASADDFANMAKQPVDAADIL